MDDVSSLPPPEEVGYVEDMPSQKWACQPLPVALQRIFDIPIRCVLALLVLQLYVWYYTYHYRILPFFR